MYQKLLLVGRVGKDPEMRYTPSGKAVATFSMATNRNHKDPAGERAKETMWWRITVWDKQAEIISQYVKKGRLVHVEGRLEGDPATGGPRIWTRSDGTAGASFEVTASNVLFLDRDPEDQGFSGGGSAPAAKEEEEFFPF